MFRLLSLAIVYLSSSFKRAQYRTITKFRVLNSLSQHRVVPETHSTKVGGREKCILIAVDSTNINQRDSNLDGFSFDDSLKELAELAETAGLTVVGICAQRMGAPSTTSFLGPGKIGEVAAQCVQLGATALLIDGDLTPRQQRGLESGLDKFCDEGAQLNIGSDNNAMWLDDFDTDSAPSSSSSSSSEPDPQLLLPPIGESTDVLLESSSRVGDDGEGQGEDEDVREQADSPDPSPPEIVSERVTPSYESGEVLTGLDRGSVSASPPKVLDRSALILEIFAQRARSKEGQLQVTLAQLQYRLTRGPREVPGKSAGADGGAGFRGPGETRIETDRRVIKDKIVRIKREIESLGSHRDQHRSSRDRLGLPVVALVGYTNAGKSSLMNRLARGAHVLAEDMLFATLDPTTRRITLPKATTTTTTTTRDSIQALVGDDNDHDNDSMSGSAIGNKGRELLLTDTVGFISRLPTHLIAAFRATLDEVRQAELLIHVIDRSSPVWQQQRRTVLRELSAIGCLEKPIVELWNKIDRLPDPSAVVEEAARAPIDAAALLVSPDSLPPSQTQAKHIPPSIDDDDNDVDSNYKRSAAASSLLFDGEDYVLLGESGQDSSIAATDDSSTTNSIPELTILPTLIVAGSVQTGQGMNDLSRAVEAALGRGLVSVRLLLPYAGEGAALTAKVHELGSVSTTDYRESGTYIEARIPPSLRERLVDYLVDN